MMKAVMVGMCLVLAGCNVTPAEYTFDNSATFEASYDDVWRSVVEYFATTNTPIDEMEKDSGLISAEMQLVTGSPEVDCGSSYFLASYSMGGTYNVFVKPVSDTEQIVTVNTRYAGAMTTSTYGTQSISCVSTGIFEERLLQFIRDGVG